ncbi:hypothetical protein, partial [Mumia zhuanghuii]|uniref:hypothetical protein n=1 Tax=Mumia zhuanghuii TaxID=2585211 RepID=UPI001E591602
SEQPARTTTTDAVSAIRQVRRDRIIGPKPSGRERTITLGKNLQVEFHVNGDQFGPKRPYCHGVLGKE